MSKPDAPPTADLTPLAEDLTLTQIENRLAPAETELDFLVEHGDRTTGVARRVRELRAFISAAQDMIAEITSTTFEQPAPPPVAHEPTPAPQAPPAPAPVAVEEPAPAPAPAPAPVPEPVAVEPDTSDGDNDTDDDGDDGDDADGGDAASAVDLSDAAIEEAMRRLRAELNNGDTVPGEGDGVEPETAPEPAPDGSTVGGAPIFATVSSGEGVIRDGATTLSAVAKRMRNLKRTAHLIPDGTPQRYALYQADRLAGAEVPRLGDDADVNTRLLFHESNELLGTDRIAAAADLSICGDPVEVQVRGCQLDSTTPFMDAIAGNAVAATDCVVRWKRPLSVEQIDPGPQLWTSCQQEDVDPSDRSTWKPITADLPPCEDYCTAQPFDTILGLGVTLNDITCRPERIDEMNRWIEVFHAILLEQTAMSIFDLQVGPQHHFAFDAASLVDTGRPPLGAIPSLAYAVHALLSRTGIDRHTPTRGWWAAVHPSIFHTLSLDAGLAEENGDGLTRLTEILSNAGVERVIVTKDFGICEGVLAAGYQGNAFLCNLENCDIPTYTDPGTGCVDFGGGVELPPLVTDTRIRFFQPENWWHGSTFLVDYALHTSAELMRQNRAEYFGERRDLLFKASNCHSLEFVLDVANLCANGQRIERLSTMPCPAPVTGGNGAPPLAPQISGVGQPNPMTLPDQTDPDPATTPPRVGVGGTNPDPGTPPGTAIPGGTTTNP